MKSRIIESKSEIIENNLSDDLNDIFTEVYQLELRVIITDHVGENKGNEALQDYCSTYSHAEICRFNNF